MNSLRLPPLALISLLSLGALDTGLVGIAWKALTSSYEASTATHGGENTGAPHAVGSFNPESRLASYSQTLARPAFLKTRRPWTAPPASIEASAVRPSPAPQAASGFSLSAVVLALPVKRAFLITKSNSAGTWISVGDVVDGWVVDSIDEAGSELRNGAIRIRVNLYVDEASNQTGHGPVAPAQK